MIINLVNIHKIKILKKLTSQQEIVLLIDNKTGKDIGRPLFPYFIQLIFTKEVTTWVISILEIKNHKKLQLQLNYIHNNIRNNKGSFFFSPANVKGNKTINTASTNAQKCKSKEM